MSSNPLVSTLLSLVKTEADANSVLSVASGSPEGELILSVLHEKVLGRVDEIVDGFIQVTLSENPNATVDDVVAIVDGDIWHYERRKLGLFGAAVDLLRNVPKFDDPIRALIRSRYEDDEAALTEKTSAAPAGETPVLADIKSADIKSLGGDPSAETIAAAEAGEASGAGDEVETPAEDAQEATSTKPGFLQSAEDLIHNAEAHLHLGAA